MNAEGFLNVALGGNTNVATLTFLSLTELLDAYTKELKAENTTLREENELLKQLCDQMDPGARDKRFRKKG